MDDIKIIDRKPDDNKDKSSKLDIYSTWNLVYSLLWVIMIIFSIVLAFLYYPNNQGWNYLWYVNVLYSLVSVAFSISFIVNLVYSILWCIKAGRKNNYAAIARYIIGIFIPFVGMIYQISNQKMNYKDKLSDANDNTSSGDYFF